MLVNGQRMARALADEGTEVRIGNTTMTVRLVEEPA
jgi:hypothetical protein